jgi:hypothetical protein
MGGVFPIYDLVLAATALVAALAAAPSHPQAAGLAALVAVGFILLRRWILPHTQTLRPRREAGDEAIAKAFASLHQISAAVNLLQPLGLAVVLLRLAM